MEEALERCKRMTLASRYAGAIMHEVNNPLDAITNLVYLTKTRKDDPAVVLENMEIIEQQLAILSQVYQPGPDISSSRDRGQGFGSGRDQRVGIEITR